MKRILFVFFFFLISLNANELKKLSIQLLWLDQFQFAGYYIAKEKGFYKDLDLDVEIKKYEFGISVVDEVLKGNADFGVGRSSLLIDRSRGKDIVALSAIFQSSPLVLLSLKRDDITKVSDFFGKTIMATSSAEDTASLIAMIKSQGLYKENINFVEHTFNLDDLISGKTDLMASYVSNEPFRLEKKGFEYTIFDPKDYGFDLYSDILFTSNKFIKKDDTSVEKFRQATLKGWAYAFDNIEQSVDIIHKKYNSQNKTKEMLLFEAKELKKLAYLDTEHLGDIKKDKIKRSVDIYRILGLLKNDIMVDNFIYHYSYHLSPSQKEYMNKKDKLRVCIDSFWKPFEYNQNDVNKGISVDYMNEISSIIKKDISLISTKSFAQSKKFIKNKKCDMAILSSYKNNDTSALNTTSSYLTLPYVIATKLDASYIYSLDQIKDKKIGMVKGYAYIEEIKINYPDIQIIEFNSVKEGMRALSEAKLFAFIDIASSIRSSIKQQNFFNIKISGQLHNEWNLKIAIAQEDKKLYEIIDDVINSFTNEKKVDILNKWITVKIHREIDYSIVWQLSMFFIVLFIIFLFGFQKLKKSKDLVEESLANIERLVDTTIEGIAVSDEKDNIIIINKAALDIFGYTKNEFLKLKALDVVAPSFKKQVKKAHKESQVGPYELKLRKKDGTIFPALASGKDIIFNGKKARISTVVDLTLLKETQDDLRKLNNELELRVQDEVEKNLKKEKLIVQQSRLAQMGEIISMIAHQWRQPLSSISLTIVAMKLKLELKRFDFRSKEGVEEFKEYIFKQFNDIQNSISNLSTTIDDFRTFYKPNKRSTFVNLNDIIKKSLNIIGISLEQDEIQMIHELDELQDIAIYDNEMMQVILNILKNAQDNFIQRKIEDKKIIIRTKNLDDLIRLEIEDNGGGIESGIMPHIFDPYFSTKDDKNGTGLGLHMSKIIITEHHKGKLYAKNTQMGVKFIIELKK